MYWGNAEAASESNGSAVFKANNSYATVLHMDDTLKDEVGTITPKDAGSTAARGIVGQGRHFTPGKGVDCGDNITGYPYSDNPFTSEAWFRAETPGTTVFAWGRYATRYNGKTGAGNEVDICIGSPPRLCWLSDGPGGAASCPDKGPAHTAAASAKSSAANWAGGSPRG
jgi:hypothetical protein